MFAPLFVLMYVAHLIADYAAQTDHQAGHKADPGRAGWSANLTHAATHAAVTAIVLGVGVLALGQGPGIVPAVLAIASISATHAFIDRRWPIRWLMARTGQRGHYEQGGAGHVDQVAHVTVLLAVALVLAR